MPLIAALLVAVGLAFVARGILLTRSGPPLSRPAWLALPSKRTVGLAALAIVPLAFIAASQTSSNKVPDAVAAPERVDRVTDGDAARPEPKAQSPARAQAAPPSAASAAPQAAAPSRPAAAPAAEPNAQPRNNDGTVTNISRNEARSEPTPAPKDDEDKKGKDDDEPSSTPAPTDSGGDSDDEDD